jgi:hypothetical protein
MTGTNKNISKGETKVDAVGGLIEDDALRQRREFVLKDDLKELPVVDGSDCDGPCGGISPRDDVSVPVIENVDGGK